MSSVKPVIIIGSGVVGLTLGHGLRKSGIPFEIYERDGSIDSRDQGWAITLHWVLPYLKKLLDQETYEALNSVQVDPEVGRNDTGNFLFINLATEEAKFRIPPNERRRVNREKMRRLLLQGIADRVHWSKTLIDIIKDSSSNDVTAVFEDGSQVTGSLLIGAEGTNSRTRQFLCPGNYINSLLPVRFIGAAVDMTPDQVKPLRDLDPLLFQGCHPDTGSYLWCSMLEVPEINGTAGTPNERYRVQLNVSWPVKSPDDEVKETDAGRLAQMKQKATGWSPKLKAVIDAIPENSVVTEIRLVDWPCLEWDNRGGSVTLVGDAAHAMTMYRGEAANHGILDAYRLCEALQAIHHGESQKSAIDEFEAEMRSRTSAAVLLSRQACLDAHDWQNLNENSAVLKRRALK
ncbi:FAD/NAD(P)-binding domain-containing protein [Rhizodiscina lignyota]|uniref:FAD/NAD(P)-binding domain-containing protein n=1 Tax=Rhizodiscina lignyota TaxID=1504668 RepID=A0A9P4M496_9PEZI|nr:FAD/NAD(P)-binding domain-containing protein [Rhizodiscina lignyota]